VPEATATESTAVDDARTVGALVATERTYEEIVRIVRDRFSGARTTTRSIASIANSLRRSAIQVPRGRFADPVGRMWWDNTTQSHKFEQLCLKKKRNARSAKRMLLPKR